MKSTKKKRKQKRKMKYNFDKEAFDTIIATIESSKAIGIYMHASPDGDCIGSALALYLFLTKLGINSKTFLGS